MRKHLVIYLLSMIFTVLSLQKEVVGNNQNLMQAAGAETGLTRADFPDRMTQKNAPVRAFVEAVKDPNMLIGVFSLPSKPELTKLSSGEVLELLPGYLEASSRFSLTVLHLDKTMKGKFDESFILVSTLMPPRVEQRPITPAFIPPSGSKWVLALEKTTPAIRKARFGKDSNIEQYKFLNDRTLFKVFWHGYGALCLQWPQKGEWPRPEPRYLVKVPEAIVADFEAIQRVTPSLRKEKMDTKEVIAVDSVGKALRTELAKSIFTTLSAELPAKAVGPNNVSK